MADITHMDSREIERRRDRIRRAWRYEKVDHIPIGFFLEDSGKHTVRELCEHGELQFEVNARNMDRMWRLLPDDYLPAARVWPGYMTIATMFGLKIHWGDDPNQAPGVQEHPITDMAQVYALPKPDPATSGLMPFNLRWLRHFAEQFPPEISLTGIDLGGPINTAKDLFDTNLLFTAFYDDPDAFHHFLRLAAEVQIGCYREIIKAVGDINRLTCIDFDPMWAPEGRKGFVSDDVCAGFSADIFRQFSIPYNNLIFRLWRGGRIHNCGPHPAIDLYLHHDPEIDGLNCSYKYTKDDLPKIKKSFQGKGIVEIMFDNGESGEEMVRAYGQVAQAMAPDVVVIPIVWVTPTWDDDAIRGTHHDLQQVARSYAQEMKWAR